MQALLGLPLDEVKERLARSGKKVVCVETRSRKGVLGSDARVIRVREWEDRVEIVYAIFQTKIEGER